MQGFYCPEAFRFLCLSPSGSLSSHYLSSALNPTTLVENNIAGTSYASRNQKLTRKKKKN